MLISLSGVQCTGKTETMALLREDNYLKDNFEFKTEIVRTLKNMGVAINEEGTSCTQAFVFLEHLSNIIKGNIITDRSVLDAMVYTTYSYYHKMIPESYFLYFLNIFEKTYDKYDVFFYLPPEIAVIEDGVRSVNKEFREETHNLFLTYIENYELRAVQLPGPPLIKAHHIINFIKGDLK